MIRVLVADDNPVIRGGLLALLATLDDVEVVGEAATGQEAIERAQVLTPDVVLLDVRMPVLDGVSAAATIARTTRVLMLTYSDEPDIVTSAVRAGASGYVLKGDSPSCGMERVRVHGESGPAARTGDGEGFAEDGGGDGRQLIYLSTAMRRAKGETYWPIRIACSVMGVSSLPVAENASVHGASIAAGPVVAGLAAQLTHGDAPGRDIAGKCDRRSGSVPGRRFQRR